MSLSIQYVVAIRVTPQSAQLQSESQSLTLAHLLWKLKGNEALGIKLKVDFFVLEIVTSDEIKEDIYV